MTMKKEKIEKVAQYCAGEAYQQGSGTPKLLPLTPLEGDWDYLALELDRQPTDEEIRDFVEVYNDTILDLVGALAFIRARED